MKKIKASAGFSKLIFAFGLLFIAMAVGLYLWGVDTSQGQSNSEELMTRIGQVAGGLGGLGIVIVIISFFKKSKTGQ